MKKVVISLICFLTVIPLFSQGYVPNLTRKAIRQVVEKKLEEAVQMLKNHEIAEERNADNEQVRREWEKNYEVFKENVKKLQNELSFYQAADEYLNDNELKQRIARAAILAEINEGIYPSEGFINILADEMNSGSESAKDLLIVIGKALLDRKDEVKAVIDINNQLDSGIIAANNQLNTIFGKTVSPNGFFNRDNLEKDDSRLLKAKVLKLLQQSGGQLDNDQQNKLPALDNLIGTIKGKYQKIKETGNIKDTKELEKLQEEYQKNKEILGTFMKVCKECVK